MKAVFIVKEFTSELSFQEVAKTFFRQHSAESVQVWVWKFFQCWINRDCEILSDLTNKEVALFLDQLVDLVAAAQILHEANRVKNEPGEEDRNA